MNTGVSVMRNSYEILCINKSNHTAQHERIINVGGIYPDGRRWKVTQEKVISDIESRRLSYYVKLGGKTVNVIVSTSASGNKYIKTASDNIKSNNLLSLPECP